MPSLREHYLAKKWEQEVFDKDGKLKESHRYGECRRLPIRDDLIVLSVRGVGIKHCTEGYLEDLVTTLGRMASEQGKTIQVYIWNGISKQWGELGDNVHVSPHEDSSRPAAFAQACTILTAGFLPVYFTPRPEQRVVNIWAEPEDLNPSNRCTSPSFTSRLLNSTHILVESEKQAEVVLHDYHMRGIYVGKLLCWNGKGTYAEGIGHLAIHGSASQFTCIDSSSDKKRVLLCCRPKDAPAYAALAHDLISSYDSNAIDLTLLLMGSPRDLGYLDSLRTEVRVICRGTTFPLSTDEFQSTMVNLASTGDFASYETWRRHFVEQVIADELRRLLGPSTFDELVYCAEPNALAYSLAGEVSCKRKVRLYLSQHTDQGRVAISHSSITESFDHSVCQKVFDTIFVDSPEMLRLLEQTGDLEGMLEHFDPALLSINHEGNDTYRDDAIYEGRPYALITHSQHGGRMQCTMLPLPPGTRTAYLINATDEDALRLMAAVAAESTDDWECVIAGSLSTSTAEEVEATYPGQVQQAGDLAGMGLQRRMLQRYVGSFDAYVTGQQDRHDTLRLTAAQEQIDVMECSANGLTHLPMQTPPTDVELEELVQAEVARIIG